MATRECDAPAETPEPTSTGEAPIRALWGGVCKVLRAADGGLAWLAGIDVSQEQASQSDVPTKIAAHSKRVEMSKACEPAVSDADAMQLFAMATGHCELFPVVIPSGPAAAALPVKLVPQITIRTMTAPAR